MSKRPTNCDNCGACCLTQNLLPLSGNMVDGANRLPDAMRITLEAVLDGPLAGGDECPCIWLDRTTGKCMNYGLRPDMCREVLEPGDETCMGIRTDAGL